MVQPEASRELPGNRRRSPLIVALDFRTADAALRMARLLREAPVGMFKIGLELFTAAGPALVAAIRGEKPDIFLDLKFHDIPNTTAGAARAAAGLGVSLLNVHAAGGLEMMRAAVAAVREVSPSPRLIAVTLLTSLNQQDMARAGVSRTPRDQVLRYAEMAAEAGLDGVVASAEEAADLRARFPRPFLLVTPGIRPARRHEDEAGEPRADDQKRVATPGEALAAGADYIVVGRPITGAPDPAAAAARIFEEVRAFLADF